MASPDSSAHPKAPLLSRAAWARVLPFLVYMSFLLVAELLSRLGMSPDALRWLYPVKTAAVLLVLEPSLLALPALPLPRLRGREVVVAAVPPGQHERPRDLEAAGSTARALSGRAPRWCARDAAEQQVWRTESWELPLLGEVLREVLPGQASVRGAG